MFADSTIPQSAPVFSTCLTGQQLLLDLMHKQSWQTFRECIPISDEDFDHYYTAVLRTFAEYVQTLPASQHVFYATPGGFLQLGLERAMTATKLALQGYQDFEGLTPDQLTAHNLIELFAVFSAALLSDLGLLILRFQIKINDHDNVMNDYDPYAGSMLKQGKSFSYQFRPNELPDWPAPASLVLARQVMNETENNYRDSGFAWISRYHDILQLWYTMLLDLTPAQESSTRRRFFISLIPLVDNEMVHNFLINIHNNGTMLPSKQNLSLFNIQNQENPQNISEIIAHAETEPEALERLKKSTGFEKIFGGTTMADASNALMLGSVSATLPPLLRYGLAFLGWLLVMARTPGAFAQAGISPYGLEGGKVAFDAQDVQKLQKLFNKDGNFVNVSSQDLLGALQKIQMLRAQKISVNQLAWKNDLTTQFTALMLPPQFAVGDLAGLKRAMNLSEVGGNRPQTEHKSSFLLGSRDARSRFIFGL